MRLRLIIPSILALFLAACSGAPAGSDVSVEATETPHPTDTAAAVIPTETLPPPPTATPAATSIAPWCPIAGSAPERNAGQLRIALLGDTVGPDPSKQVWLWTEAGGPVLLSSADDPWENNPFEWIGFSDDGTRVAYTLIKAQYQVELWSVRLDEGEPIRLIAPEGFSRLDKDPAQIVIPIDLHWVPGTHTIGFHANLAATSWGFRYTPDNLWWIDADTGEALQKDVDGEVFYSPDGALAAAVNQEHLLLMDADGSDQRIVPLENYHTMPYGPTYSEPPRVHWAEDSRSLFVIAPEAAGVTAAAAPDAMVTIWRVDAADAKAVPYARYNADYASIDFSPDHQWVAFWRYTDEQLNRSGLSLMKADGSQGIPYAEDATGVDWAPDSRHFILWSNTQPYLGGVCAAPIPLMENPALEAFRGEEGVAFRAEWIDPERFILAVDNGRQLFFYLYDVSAQEAQLLFSMEGIHSAMFDGQLIPAP